MHRHLRVLESQVTPASRRLSGGHPARRWGRASEIAGQPVAAQTGTRGSGSVGNAPMTVICNGACDFSRRGTLGLKPAAIDDRGMPARRPAPPKNRPGADRQNFKLSHYANAVFIAQRTPVVYIVWAS